MKNYEAHHLIILICHLRRVLCALYANGWQRVEKLSAKNMMQHRKKIIYNLQQLLASY
jgi:hypothetical protein